MVGAGGAVMIAAGTFHRPVAIKSVRSRGHDLAGHEDHGAGAAGNPDAGLDHVAEPARAHEIAG